MLYLYFDEAYNLQAGSENQFLLIGGFGTNNPTFLSKQFQRIKRYGLPKQWRNKEVKSTNSLFNQKLQKEIVQMFQQSHDPLFIIVQEKSRLSHLYFAQNQLNYDKLYFELLKKLILQEIMPQEATRLIITIDDFTPQLYTKKEIKTSIETEFKMAYADKSLDINFAYSHNLLLLQIADLICGLLYKLKIGINTELALNRLSIKIINNLLK